MTQLGGPQRKEPWWRPMSGREASDRRSTSTPLLVFPFNGNGLEAIDCLGDAFHLVGFIDADGTCDPLDFAEMCRVIVEDDVDRAKEAIRAELLELAGALA